MNNAEHIARYAQLPLEVESELGQCSMSVRDILSLGPGSIIKLSRPIGAPVDLFVGGARFGSGKMLRTGERLGIRITGFATKKRD